MADWHENVVRVLDAESLTVTATVAVQKSPSGLAVNRSGTRLYVTNRDSHSLTVMDTVSNKVIATIPTGERPFGLMVDSQDNRVYTANVKSNDVTVIDKVLAYTRPKTDVGPDLATKDQNGRLVFDRLSFSFPLAAFNKGLGTVSVSTDFH